MIVFIGALDVCQHMRYASVSRCMLVLAAAPCMPLFSDSVREAHSLWHAGLPACSALGLIAAVVSGMAAWLSCIQPFWGPCGQAVAGAAWWAVHTHTQWVCAVVAALAPVTRSSSSYSRPWMAQRPRQPILHHQPGSSLVGVARAL